MDLLTARSLLSSTVSIKKSTAVLVFDTLLSVAGTKAPIYWKDSYHDVLLLDFPICKVMLVKCL